METMSVENVFDEIAAADSVISLEGEKENLAPEARLIARVLQLAVEDLDAALGLRGTATQPSADECLNMASAAYFFLKGPAEAYMRLLGVSSALPAMQHKALAVMGGMGAWSHLVKLKGEAGGRRLAGAMCASRSAIGIRQMKVPASQREGLSHGLLSLV